MSWHGAWARRSSTRTAFGVASSTRACRCSLHAHTHIRTLSLHAVLASCVLPSCALLARAAVAQAERSAVGGARGYTVRWLKSLVRPHDEIGLLHLWRPGQACVFVCVLLLRTRRKQQPAITPKETKLLVTDLAAYEDQRSYNLPRTMRLSDIVKCYNTFWDMEEGYGD